MNTYINKTYDITIIGSGPGGHVAALKSASLGLKVALIEKDTYIGGTCLHKGCIPTKALLHTAEILNNSKKAYKFGIKIENISYDWPAIQEYVNKIITNNAAGLLQLLKFKNIDIFYGHASFIDSNHIKIINKNIIKQLKTNKTIIAVGSTPKSMQYNISNTNKILDSNSIFALKQIPKSLIIIGGGIVGVEFASIFSQFGTKITILETLPNIISIADIDCSIQLKKNLEKQNIKIYTNIKIEQIQYINNNIHIIYQYNNKTQHIQSEYLLYAIGRKACTDTLNLQNTKVITRNNFIKTNNNLQTNDSNIYAIGDCIDTPALAHVASMEGIHAIYHILQHKNYKKISYKHIPTCIYTFPNVAWCGLTENNIPKHYNIKISKFNLSKNSKAYILQERQGFIKLITDTEYGEILGIHIIGPQAAELLAEPTFAMHMEATVNNIAENIHAHPTLYESLYEIANIAINKTIYG